ncbi:MAG: hypothetical protein WC531_02730 [Candidatus Paceibacterota bacterium]|jgi:succinate dehydrogenase/fumarate reductase cytochrome b subunit
MKLKNKKIFSVCLVILGLLIFNLPTVLVLGASTGYTLLEPSVIIDRNNTQPEGYGLQEYLTTAYLMLFVLVVAASIFYLILGGLEYILSDIPNMKLDGMRKLKNALLGLGIALVSVLLLKLINPKLLDFSLAGIT